MLNKYQLDINTNWNSLPWQKIYNKILIIQAKIYQVTKKYNINDKRKLQKYLINSTEIKIFCIENIIKKLYLYYNYKKSHKYYLTDKNKFYIFKVLFNKHTHEKYKYIIKVIKNFLFFLCINPELKAKIPKFKYKYLTVNYSNIIQTNYLYGEYENFNIINLYKIKPIIFHFITNNYYLRSYKKKTVI